MKATANMNCSLCVKRGTCWGNKPQHLYPATTLCRLYKYDPTTNTFTTTKETPNVKPSQNGHEQVDALETMLPL